jgi:hypothetical protein
MPLQQQQSNDDGEKAATAKEQLKQNARLQTLVQKAGIPLRELQDSLIAAGGGQRSATVVPTTTSSSSSTNPLKRTPKLDFGILFIIPLKYLLQILT